MLIKHTGFFNMPDKKGLNMNIFSNAKHKYKSYSHKKAVQP